MSGENKKESRSVDKQRKADERQQMSDERRNEIQVVDKRRKTAVKTEQRTNSFDVFLQNIKMGPWFICMACHRQLYEQTVDKVFSKTFAQIDPEFFSATFPVLTNTGSEEFIQKFICKTCLNSLKKTQIPAQATANELGVSELNEPLSSLTDFEARLVSQRLLFMKILALPRGRQKSIHGTVVNVPVDTSHTCSLLPRMPTNSGLIPVKLKRKLEYRGHVEFQKVSPELYLHSST